MNFVLPNTHTHTHTHKITQSKMVKCCCTISTSQKDLTKSWRYFFYKLTKATEKRSNRIAAIRETWICGAVNTTINSLARTLTHTPSD